MTGPKLFLFGAARAVRADGVPVAFRGRKALALFAYLTLTGETHRRERLAALFWPDLPADNARNNLRVVLSRIGKGLGDSPVPWLVAERQHVRANPEAPLWIDAREFEAHVDASARHDHGDAPLCDDCHDRLTSAVDLYRGAFLEGLELEGCDDFEAWRRTNRDGYELATHRALDRLSAHGEAVADLVLAEAHTRRLLRLDPLHEGSHRRMMRLLSHQDRRALALEHFQAYQAYLQSELGLEPEDETVTLYHQIRAGTLQRPITAAVASFVRGVANHNLPADLTPFIGRERELERLTRHLQEQRLITLTGIGGIGKTRLALALARSRLAAFEDGVFLVRLASVQSESELPSALAEALSLGLHEDGEVEAQVLRHLADKKALIVLDNFEHLLEGRRLVRALLEGAPRLRLLVTSRQRLDVTGEAVYAVSGLRHEPLRADGAGLWPHGAAQLFLDAARRVRLDLDLEGERTHIDRICRLVEGHPLALVLAATWLESLTCAEIADELAEDVELLESDAHDLPARQRSIRAAFDHSWHRLSPEEQSTYASMAVFRGGFSRPAAREVVGASLRQLTSLLDKSLIQHLPEQGRYELHELMRQFAEERMAGDAAALRERHGRYYLERLADLNAAESSRAMEAFLEAELANLKRAWRWAVDGRQVRLLRSVLFPLVDYFGEGNRDREGLELLEAAMSVVGDDASETQAVAHLRIAHAKLCRLSSSHAALKEQVVDSLDRLGDGPDDLEAKVEGLLLLAFLDSMLGLHEHPIRHVREALRLAEAADRRRLMAGCLHTLGIVERDRGEREASLRAYQLALQHFEALGDRAAAYTLARIAEHMLNEGRYEDALERLADLRPMAREQGQHYVEQNVLQWQAECSFLLGRLEEAERLLDEALAGARSSAYTALTPHFEILKAHVLVRQGALERARASLEATLRRVWREEVHLTLYNLIAWAAYYAAREQRGRAIALLSAVAQHPATAGHHRRQALELLADLGAEPQDPPVALAALVGELLSEGESGGVRPA